MTFNNICHITLQKPFDVEINFKQKKLSSIPIKLQATLMNSTHAYNNAQ